MTVSKQVIGTGQLKLSGIYHRSGDIVTLMQDAFDALPDEKRARLQDAPAKDGTSQPNPCGGDASAGEQTTGSAKDGHSPLEGAALQQALVKAIYALDGDNGALWTKSDDRKPLTDALTERVGQSISASQRDAAWQEVLAHRAADELERAGGAI